MRPPLLINSNNKRALIGMKAGLTEIGKHWEYKHNERLVAAIEIEASGQARFYLDARQISVN
ncbi:hypothetical protein [Aeromonas sp.]|uniref:hypothetical protein n=1 Tax=Aeromonas sp. TaxID=647 RepID=UPI00338F283E